VKTAPEPGSAPAPETAPPPQTSPGEAPVKGAQVTEKIVAEELKLGKKYIQEGDLDLGRLFLKNASALDMLRPPGTDTRLSNEIQYLLSRCQAVGARVKRRCTECDGTGKRRVGIRRLRGEMEYLASMVNCDRCGGKGFFTDEGQASEGKFRVARALNTYTQLQQGRRYVPVGGAWIPADLESLLTIRQTVTLKRSTALPCEECMGVGRTDCEECKGTALVKCPNRDCENGWVEDEKAGQLSKLSVIRHRERCAICRGRGKAPCEDCTGRGSIVCEECGGTGQRALCSRCGGQGMAPCRRCRGSGTYRGAKCETCGSSGSSLCSSCNGEGRKK